MVLAANRILPIDVTETLQTTFRPRAVLLSFLGVLLTTRMGYGSQCQTCEHPAACLIYTECLKHGSVMLAGYEACSPSFKLTGEALDSLLHTTNLTSADLACGRDLVVCHDVEGLERHGCTDVGLATGSADETYCDLCMSNLGCRDLGYVTGEVVCHKGDGIYGVCADDEVW